MLFRSYQPNSYGPGIMDILDYKNTNKYKTIRTLAGHNNNTTGTNDGETSFTSTLLESTSAITTLTFTLNSGGNFKQYTSLALYGVK